MRRDLFIPAAAFAATIATGLVLVALGPGGALYLSGSILEAGWIVAVWFVRVVLGPAIAVLFLSALLTDRDRKRRVRETRGVWR